VYSVAYVLKWLAESVELKLRRKAPLSRAWMLQMMVLGLGLSMLLNMVNSCSWLLMSSSVLFMSVWSSLIASGEWSLGTEESSDSVQTRMDLAESRRHCWNRVFEMGALALWLVGGRDGRKGRRVVSDGHLVVDAGVMLWVGDVFEARLVRVSAVDAVSVVIFSVLYCPPPKSSGLHWSLP